MKRKLYRNEGPTFFPIYQIDIEHKKRKNIEKKNNKIKAANFIDFHLSSGEMKKILQITKRFFFIFFFAQMFCDFMTTVTLCKNVIKWHIMYAKRMRKK